MEKNRIAKNKGKTGAGVCILCGGEKEGTPAKADFAISSARKLRKLFRMGERHTIACKTCLPLCEGKRLVFEKKLGNYRISAGIFFLVMLAGSLSFGSFDLRIFVPAIIGALIIFLLPYGYYFPAFEMPEKK